MTLVLMVVVLVMVVVWKKGHLAPLCRMLGYCQTRPDEAGVLSPRWRKPEEKRSGTVVLDSGKSPFFNPVRLSAKAIKRTNVPVDTLGVVIAKVGRDPSPTKGLQDHVECRYFQDGGAFLRNGGQRGRQPGVLPGGTSYAIDPDLFEVITTETVGNGRSGLTSEDLREVSVPEGAAGVVIVREGAAPDEDAGEVAPRVPGHDSFQLPHVFLANCGQRGVQEEILTRGGTYRINPWFARVVLVPTRDLTLRWTEREDQDQYKGYDSNLRPIRVNVKGHRIRCDVTQEIRIPASTAPRLVGRIGETKSSVRRPDDLATIRRFVDGVLSPTVEGYLQSTASEQEDPVAFLESLDQVRTELEDKVRQALRDWGVEGISTTITKFVSEDEKLDEGRRKKTYAESEGERLAQERKNKAIANEILVDKIKVDRYKRKQDNDAFIELLRSQQAVERAKEAHVIFSEEQVTMVRVLNVQFDDVLAKLKEMRIEGDEPTSEQITQAIRSAAADKELPRGENFEP